eukprot:1671967-Rhodomonas_salina.3
MSGTDVVYAATRRQQRRSYRITSAAPSHPHVMRLANTSKAQLYWTASALILRLGSYAANPNASERMLGLL